MISIVTGFEPVISRFVVWRLCPLGHTTFYTYVLLYLNHFILKSIESSDY